MRNGLPKKASAMHAGLQGRKPGGHGQQAMPEAMHVVMHVQHFASPHILARGHCSAEALVSDKEPTCHMDTEATEVHGLGTSRETEWTDLPTAADQAAAAASIYVRL